MSTASKIEGKNGDVVLAANNVAKSYGRIHALKGVNFEIAVVRSRRFSAKTALANRR